MAAVARGRTGATADGRQRQPAGGWGRRRTGERLRPGGAALGWLGDGDGGREVEVVVVGRAGSGFSFTTGQISDGWIVVA